MLNISLASHVIVREPKTNHVFEITGESISFYPTVCTQRYNKVRDIIEKCNKEYIKLVDIGCSELGLFKHLKKLNCISEMILLDIDYELLKFHASEIQPQICDYVEQRSSPLNVKLVAGDAMIPHQVMLNANIVTMIELIEHMYEYQLPQLLNTVFDFIQPEIVIISTPNADFNQYFPSLNGKFRHYDHKFEWTSQQFQKWCNTIVDSFSSYEVEFTGCGYGPGGIWSSQIAVFTIKLNALQLKDGLIHDSKCVPSKNIASCNGLLQTVSNIDSKASNGPVLGTNEYVGKICDYACDFFATTQSCRLVFESSFPYVQVSKLDLNQIKILEAFNEFKFWLKNVIKNWDTFDQSSLIVPIQDRSSVNWSDFRNQYDNVCDRKVNYCGQILNAQGKNRRTSDSSEEMFRFLIYENLKIDKVNPKTILYSFATDDIFFQIETFLAFAFNKWNIEDVQSALQTLNLDTKCLFNKDWYVFNSSNTLSVENISDHLSCDDTSVINLEEEIWD